MNRRQTRAKAIEQSQYWWYCDNIVNHPGQVGLLHMGFPRLFILIRDYDTAYWSEYERWKNDIVEVTFMERADAKETTKEQLDALLTDAWNFLILEEEEEEKQAEQSMMEDEMYGEE